MLVLSRKIGESILIQVGNLECRFTITGNRNGNLKLAFDAPQEFVIVRDELRKQKDSDRNA